MITIEQMIQREVLCCMSSVVSAMAQTAGCTISGTRARRDDAALALSNLCEQASELAAPVLDYEEAALQAGWTQQPDGRWWREPSSEKEANSDRAEMFLGSWPFIYADDVQDACKYDAIDPYEWEVYEHWAVSTWFAEQLIAQGEHVNTDFAGLNVWARTCTGQAINMDGAVRKIYGAMVAPVGASA